MKDRGLRQMSVFSAFLALFMVAPVAFAQTTPGPLARPKLVPRATPEGVLLNALATDPVTAPYAFRIGRSNGKLVLAGRVGTKEVHDTAVRIALNATSSIDDRLIIDTAEVRRAVARPPTSSVLLANSAGPGYVYPPPLFGRLDDPFYGFEPPLTTYPPWWGVIAARRGDPYAAPVLDPYSPISPDPGPAPPPPKQPVSGTNPAAVSGPSVEMSIDPRGTAVLRGVVPSEETRMAIGQKAAKLPGVKEIVNLLEVDPNVAEAALPIGGDQPPPPPMPAQVPPPPVPQGTEPLPKVAPTEIPGSVDHRLAQSLERRPALEGKGIKTEVKDGVAYLSGKVPTVLEAMMAFRTAQQTVGVREVVDRLEFAVPDGIKPNPLITSARPDDLEPYLEAQIRRQVNDRAHIDRVRVSGDRLELRGTVARAEDKPAVEAILRSMPLLRGFTIDSKLISE